MVDKCIKTSTSFHINGLKKMLTLRRTRVMSCFCCGGGSSFGYKLAGYDVVACNEIDPKVMKMYLKNHDVKYAFNCDIRELIANINMGGIL